MARFGSDPSRFCATAFMVPSRRLAGDGTVLCAAAAWVRPRRFMKPLRGAAFKGSDRRLCAAAFMMFRLGIGDRVVIFGVRALAALLIFNPRTLALCGILS
jgi:hypothetical protein